MAVINERLSASAAHQPPLSVTVAERLEPVTSVEAALAQDQSYVAWLP